MRIPDTAEHGWLDGEWLPLTALRITVDDPAFHAGLGLFETVAVRQGRLLELDEHLERLDRGAERLSVPLPDRALLRRTLSAAARPTPFGWLKLVVTRGGHWFVFVGAMDPAEEGRAVRAVLLPWRRNPADPLAGCKTLNYAPSILGTEEAARRGAEEGIWLNSRGHLAEANTSNLFVVQRRRLYTPSVRDGILPGVVRALVLSAAQRLGFTVHKGKLRLRRLEQAHEAFLTSSLRGVRPLIEYAGRAIGQGKPGPVTRAIAAAVAEMRKPS